MAEPFLGEVRLVGFNFAPIGWALCNGQIMSIQQNAALFALLGTNFGGNGTSNFGLPNLQGNVPIGQGAGRGLSQRIMGETGGSTQVTLLTTQMPAHTHLVNSSNSPAEQYSPVQAFPNAAARKVYATSGGNFASSTALSEFGGNQPHDNLQPYLVVTFIIALQGIFPTRG